MDEGQGHVAEVAQFKIGRKGVRETTRLQSTCPVLAGRGPERHPALDSLPERFVLKPAEGWSSNHVYCVVNGHDLLTHKPVKKKRF